MAILRKVGDLIFGSLERERAKRVGERVREVRGGGGG